VQTPPHAQQKVLPVGALVGALVCTKVGAAVGFIVGILVGRTGAFVGGLES